MRIPVGEKYEDGEAVNVYYYADGQLESIASAVAVKDGYLEIGIEKGVDYLLTMSEVPGLGAQTEEKKDDGNKGFNAAPLLAILLGAMTAVALVGWCLFAKSKKHSNPNPNPNSSPNLNQNPNPNPTMAEPAKPAASDKLEDELAELEELSKSDGPDEPEGLDYDSVD